jgi:hypothetical protein
MGDMADMALDDVMTMEEFRLDYRLGNLSQGDAYDLGIVDELGYEASPKTARKYIGNKCPVCGSVLVIRAGKYGDFKCCPKSYKGNNHGTWSV